ncbi:ABC transporter [Lutibacter agarilyticus]|uniref:ABC transporter n=1 Tax=Lutibacter agarilyticus TaxID=1109740 RepID=A0A238XPK7_9FLAO|nr:AAA family ATPase [Lutibacter agarilyticus]SNR60650.1 ABC transporter [Lutibacter agarilyticus]
MTENKYKFNIPTSNNGTLNIPLTEGNTVFVLGANGVGKSTLMHNLFNQNRNHAKRILAHRQTWFTDNAMNMTASQKKNTETNIKSSDSQTYSRWKDNYSQARTSLSIFDLINSHNIRARNIADAVDGDNIELAQEHSRDQAPIQAINELLAISNIPITIILGKDEQLFASKNGSEPYSIAELSDGERNALLIGADVLTTEPNSLIILDEPERHLHRSIISPLLTSLFRKREDCVFVISTHDIHLPIDCQESSTLLIRSCQWQGKNIKDWDADLITADLPIPISIKTDILGSKRELLFVEGQSTSLDRQIYQLIYPNVSVIPQGNCREVEKAVNGIKKTDNIHWINAFGLIDTDDRTPEQVQALLEKGVAAIPFYSVEALYYHLHIIEKVAQKISELTGQNATALNQKATENIISDISQHKERLCSKLCEKKLRNEIMLSMPKHREIQQRGQFNVTFDLDQVLQDEESHFDSLVANSNQLELLTRYPIRETQVLNRITSSLGLTKEQYENTVRKLILDSTEIKYFYRTLLQPLTELIE